MIPASESVILARLRILGLKGMHVALLDPDELETFNDMCQIGLAYRDYNFLGIARVGIR